MTIDPAAILALISELTTQLSAVTAERDELAAEVAQLRKT